MAKLRHIVLMKFKPGTGGEAVEALERGLRELSTPGLLAASFGRDLNLRDSNFDFGLVLDFESLDAYRLFDTHEAHERIRRELTRPIVETAAAVQYEV